MTSVSETLDSDTGALGLSQRDTCCLLPPPCLRTKMRRNGDVCDSVVGNDTLERAQAYVVNAESRTSI